MAKDWPAYSGLPKCPLKVGVAQSKIFGLVIFTLGGAGASSRFMGSPSKYNF
jgi:hypothetical protein